ncbi:cullin [Acrasis kona]|uniref:Cullin-4 n=1 Tax=Acrasis kona TaxID=1008807 RepID=A0AAW2Z9F4_9EUKA
MSTGPNAISKKGQKRKNPSTASIASVSSPQQIKKRKIIDVDQDHNLSTLPTNNTNMSGFQRRKATVLNAPPGAATSGPVVANTLNKKKVLKIKPFDIQPMVSPTFEQDTWNVLKKAVVCIFNTEGFNMSSEELYKCVTDMCLHNLASNLFSKLKAECVEHVKSLQQQLINRTPEPLAYLRLVAGTWNRFIGEMDILRSIFLYLDRTFVMNTPTLGYTSLWDMGLNLFRAHVAETPEIEQKIVQGLLHLIKQERDGESIDRAVVQQLIRMLVTLQLYTAFFESKFIEETVGHYREEGKLLMNERNVEEYLLHIENRLKQETDRCKSFLPQQTKRALIQALEQQLIAAHSKDVLAKGFDHMMSGSEGRPSDLSRLYSLLKMVDGMDDLKASFCEYIKKNGLAIVNDVERDKTMVQDVLEFKSKIDNIFETSFQKNEQLKFSIKSSFESFLNSRQNKPAELIAKFIDSKLRSGNKGQSEEELDRSLDNAIVLFRFINGKDMFEAFYKKDLAKRLLLNRSASTDAEKQMIGKLKTECGSVFTNKLEGMFKDVDISHDLMNGFKKSQAVKKMDSNMDLNVTVITTGYWPSYNPEPVNLPLPIAQLQDVFKEFYLEKHTGRLLKWQNSLGQCTLRAELERGKKELQVSVYQAVTLLLFNDKQQYTYDEIQTLTGIVPDELKRTLQSLSVSKVKVLKKSVKGVAIDVSHDVFSLNDKFEHPLFRIRINNVQMEETKEEQENTEESVFVDRQYQIDACVVRIMKARKTLPHQQLMAELLHQLRFPCKGSEIKKRIESLLDREYIERVTGGSDANCTYKYVA